jgi:hypothetical protein
MRISKRFDNATLHVISAHRAPDGVVTSERSQHGKGTASDIRVEGVSVETLAAVAKQEGARGVGMYPKSRFVHVDVREKAYSWIDNGEGEDDERDTPELREESEEIEAEGAPSMAADESPSLEPRTEPKVTDEVEGPLAQPTPGVTKEPLAQPALVETAAKLAVSL